MTSRMHRSEPTSGMPSEEELDEMSNLIARCDFDKVAQPEHRAIIMDLAIKANQAGCMEDMAKWFRMSKLWDGI